MITILQFPETAGNIYFEYRPVKPESSEHPMDTDSNRVSHDTVAADVTHDGRAWPACPASWSASNKIIMYALHKRNQSPSQIMEELLAQHAVPLSKQMALFARVRLATYFADPGQRHKCIRARLQALSILCEC